MRTLLTLIASFALSITFMLPPPSARAESPQSSPPPPLSLVTAYVEHGLTADGTYTHEGVAACPSYLPFGTRVAIPGLPSPPFVVTCHDRYARFLSMRFDVWRPTLPLAYAVTGYYSYSLVAATLDDGSPSLSLSPSLSPSP